MALDPLTPLRTGRAPRAAVLLPLLRSVVENLASATPARALTGSFARADVETVRSTCARFVRPRRLGRARLYELLGAHESLKLAESAGADGEAVARVRDALASGARGARGR